MLKHLHKRLIAGFFFGLASGLPLALTLSTLNAWLAKIGINTITIGLFGLVTLPYVVNFLWAPIFDSFSIPLLTPLFGHRRSWLFILQIALSAAIICLGNSNPIFAVQHTAMWAFCVALLAASQEIVINAYRAELFSVQEQSIGATSVILGYRTGIIISSGLALLLADKLTFLCQERSCMTNWSITYTIMALILFVGSIAAILIGEPKITRDSSIKGFTLPFTDFTSKHRHWLFILLFIATYRLPDAFIHSMINPFLIDIGFSLTTIGLVAKSFGFVFTMVGSTFGGILVHKKRIIFSLLICNVLQVASKLVFIMQNTFKANVYALWGTFLAESTSSGMATAALVTYASYMCMGKYIASQYALLNSLASAGRVLLPPLVGLVATYLGWNMMFITSMILSIPSMLLWFVLKKTDNFTDK